MYTCLALCALLGINVEYLRKMKFTGDDSAQRYIESVVEDMSEYSGLWRHMQECLDAYEMCKRLYASRSFIKECQNETITQFYNIAYDLLFLALKENKISKEVFKKRLKFLKMMK